VGQVKLEIIHQEVVMIAQKAVQNVGVQILHLVHHASSVMSHLMGMKNVIGKITMDHVLVF